MNKTILILLVLILSACAQTQPVQRTYQPPAQQVQQTPPVQVIPPTKQEAPKNTTPLQIGQVRVFNVEADDSGFYPSSEEVNKGDEVTINIKVRTTNVYHSGLDFKSDLFNSPSTSPGDTWTSPTFNIQSTLTIGSYWPTTSVHKKDFVIKVN